MKCCGRAPFLFAVLLRKAGVAPKLLGLIAEPARASVQSLGIIARRQRPDHINAFLAALKEIADRAQADSCEGCQICLIGLRLQAESTVL